MTGPQTKLGDHIHGLKYRSAGESFREAMNRVANALKDDDAHFHEFRDVLLDMRFLPGGRIQSAMGSGNATTPYNCFVSGNIEDSFVDGEGSIMDRAAEAAATMRLGGGIGYDFSTLRPRGALVKRLGSQSSGPVSFMSIFNAVCNCVASAGHRRGAQMGVLRVDHPDIEEFVRAKQNDTALTGFNISVGITDKFMQAVKAGSNFTLAWGGRAHRDIDARALWETIMRSTWDWAEPGVMFLDTINRNNNLSYIERIAATNPCGEQPLPPHGACLLGSFNLTKYIRGDKSFDFGQFNADIPVVVRAMDNVIDRARYPLAAQEREAKAKRRMGLGVTGAANAIEAMGYAYGENDFIRQLRHILLILAQGAYRASAKLAREKGPFPLHECRFSQSPFVARMPETIREQIAQYGIRNSHLTSIAPTGTISLAADNVSSGIEPVFDYEMRRPIGTPTGPEMIAAQDYGLANFGVRGKRAKDVAVAEHVAVLAAAQDCVDSAVSKTCNVDGGMPWEKFKRIYETAWEAGCKGCTTFNADGKRGALLTAATEGECRIDIETGRRDCG